MPLKSERGVENAVGQLTNALQKADWQIDHDESCNCCCCTSQQTCYKYLQPEVPKSFAPIRRYWKSTIPMDSNTTYQLSYWECPNVVEDPILPRNWLVTGDGEISDETTYSSSYLENLCVKPELPITPCEKQWLGRGPMQNVTTQKHDYTWKSMEPVTPYKAQDHIYCQPARLLDDTTYKLSYYQSGCHLPAISYAPIRKYLKSGIPMEDHTTHKLSYWPHDVTPREIPQWSKQQYMPSCEPVESCTTYKLSYWPHSSKRRPPIILPETDNFLNAGCCTDNNTTYRLSYFGADGDKRNPIRQPENILFSPCPLTYDTIHRMSFPGNWCVKQEMPIVPCDKQFLGRGPIQDVTTQKCDYIWKTTPLEPDLRHKDNLIPGGSPIECCTTYRLSYLENNKGLTSIENYAPVRTYRPSDIPMKSETVMQLSYQPVEAQIPVEKPWSEQPAYNCPVNPIDNNTTYNTRFVIFLYQ
ncbi:PREDICTED: uncharacterized protein LOC108577476 [Habropoda laboriosa]|nr:PREDICTED: uncharacterized protein LOC108577476 [Habropoda laboriosa]